MTPPEIKSALKEFRVDYPDPKKVGFLMMRFGSTKGHKRITATIKAAFEEFDLTVLRADDKTYADDLFANIQIYMHGCGFGVAVFERLEEENFNPNIALELGYMVALRKRVLLLKDNTIKTLHTDMIGRLYHSFDPQDTGSSISSAVRRWVKDAKIVAREEAGAITNLERILYGTEALAAKRDEVSLRQFRPNRKGVGKMSIP